MMAAGCWPRGQPGVGDLPGQQLPVGSHCHPQGQQHAVAASSLYSLCISGDTSGDQTDDLCTETDQDAEEGQVSPDSSQTVHLGEP